MRPRSHVRKLVAAPSRLRTAHQDPIPHPHRAPADAVRPRAQPTTATPTTSSGLDPEGRAWVDTGYLFTAGPGTPLEPRKPDPRLPPDLQTPRTTPDLAARPDMEGGLSSGHGEAVSTTVAVDTRFS